MCCSPIWEEERAATHYYTRAWKLVDTRKKMLYRYCYIPSFPAQVFTLQSQNNDSQSPAEGLPCCNPVAVRQCLFLLYPRHLCRRVYSFRLSVRPFVCSYVRSFVIPSRSWNLRPSFALKFLKWCISQQLLIRKHSYLDHSYPGG